MHGLLKYKHAVSIPKCIERCIKKVPHSADWDYPKPETVFNKNVGAKALLCALKTRPLSAAIIAVLFLYDHPYPLLGFCSPSLCEEVFLKRFRNNQNSHIETQNQIKNLLQQPRPTFATRCNLYN